MMKLIVIVCFVLCAQGCVYVAPKEKVAIDKECDTAMAYYTLGVDDTPGEGLVIINDRVGGNLPATVGSCGGDECLEVLWAIGRQIAVETAASLAYAAGHNLVNYIEKESACRNKTPDTEQAETPAPVVLEEDLNYLL